MKEKLCKFYLNIDEGTSVKNISDAYEICVSTFYDLKKQKKDILKFYGNADQPALLSNRKTMHQAKNEEDDKVLMEWIRQRRAENFPLTRYIIMTQAKKFHEELKLDNNCDYSQGWFSRFGSRGSA